MAVITQSPFDPASGAARSARSVCELLARNGWRVSFVATTASESGRDVDAATLRAVYGIDAALRSTSPGYLGFRFRGIDYSLLDTAGLPIDSARVHLAAEIDSLVFAAAANCAPGVVLTYGSSQEEINRRAALRNLGSKVVFFLRNFAYVHARSFAAVDAILTPSRHLSNEYFARHGVRSVPLPTCLSVEEVLAPSPEPVVATIINPCAEKGLGIFQEIVRNAAASRPDIPFLAVEARASFETLPSANLHVVRNTHEPWRIYSVTRVLLVPSTAPDPGPRVIAEAQVNRIPIIASDREGIAEITGSGAFLLSVTGEHAAEEWLHLICRLFDEPDFYREAALNAYSASKRYRTGEVDRMYLEFFRGVLQRGP